MVIDIQDGPNVQEPENKTEAIDVNSLPDTKIGKSILKPHLDGKVVVISNVELNALGNERTTQSGAAKVEDVLFKVHYQIQDEKHTPAHENYGGVTRFIQDDGSKSDVTIYTGGDNAAACLFKAWLAHIGKKEEDVSFKDFFKSIVGLKARLKEKITVYKGTEGYKNVVEQFL